ncbi:MAG: UvrD-helicase domain-containing protein [Peptoniphilus harei]|nr:UvrD-helicase domain-containing protein [Peptoniphilus harei]
MELSEVQKKAVYTLDKDLSLMAGAGTGKTRVLTSRFINIVKNNINPKKILAITFTKKAAQEMLGRISKELVLNNIDFEESELNVMTIHSFALEILENYSFILGINPNFKILEESEGDYLLEEAAKECLNNLEDESFKNYLLDFKSSPFEEKNNFINLYRDFKNNSLDFDDILNKSLNFTETEKSFDDLIRILDEYRSLSGNKFKTFYDNNIDELKSLKIFDNEILNNIEENLGTSTKHNDIIVEIKDLIQELKKDLEEKNKDYYKIIIKILKDIDKNYKKAKEDIRGLDYEDIISYAEILLKKPIVKRELVSRYSYILVDEYQDTNEIQNEIIRAFSSSNIFIVGDPKQSIYAFRGTDLSSYFSFSGSIEARGTSLLMNKNYRSDGEIISFINEKFKELMDPYDEMEFSYREGGGVYLYNSPEISEIADLAEDFLKKYKAEDIAILSRSNSQIDEIGEVLSARGIRYNRGERGLEEIEILSLVKNILSAIYSPKEFLEFLSLFNSKLLNFEFKDLVSILNEGINNSEDLLNYKSSRENIKNFISFLRATRKKASYLMIDEVLDELMDYFYDLGTLRESDWEYIYRFKEEARNFVENNSNDFRAFERQISSMTFEDLEDGINLLTIHKSKGLEFDGLIISHMDKGKKLGNNNRIIVDRDLGLGINSDLSNYSYREISNKLREIDEEEEIRVLYVAMTRAKKELILFGDLKKARSGSYFSLLGDINDIKEYEISSIEERQVEKSFLPLDVDIKFENRIREYYTVTDFINFKRSKRDFYYKYFLGIDNYTKGQGTNQIMDSKTLGNIVHMFAYKYGKNDLKNKDIEDILKDIFLYYEEELNQDKLNVSKRLVLNYLEMEENCIIDKELLFYYDLEGFLVKGYIDQVIKINGDYYILDLKTSYGSVEDLKKTYENQVILYSAIYEKLYKVKIKAAYIFDLRGKNKIVVETSEEKYKKVMDEFLNYIKFIRSHKLLRDYL